MKPWMLPWLFPLALLGAVAFVAEFNGYAALIAVPVGTCWSRSGGPCCSATRARIPTRTTGGQAPIDRGVGGAGPRWRAAVCPAAMRRNLFPRGPLNRADGRPASRVREVRSRECRRSHPDRVPDRLGPAQGGGPGSGDAAEGGQALVAGPPYGAPGRVRTPDLVNLALSGADRRSRRRRELGGEPVADRLADVDEPNGHDELLGALAALPPRQRTVLVLRYFLDLPEAEVAAAMKCSLGTVKSTSSRGLARLEQALRTTNDTRSIPT